MLPWPQPVQHARLRLGEESRHSQEQAQGDPTLPPVSLPSSTPSLGLDCNQQGRPGPMSDPSQCKDLCFVPSLSLPELL